MDIKIRKEDPRDFRQVEELAREVFWNMYAPGANEHYVIHKMRNHKDYIKDLTFVAETDDEIVGAIFYTKSKVIQDNKEEFETISFGPVFVSPLHQRKGIGRKLITHSIKIAKEMGFSAILILGYPHHYEPYGFLGSKKYNISNIDGKYYKALLALPLRNDSLNDVSGYVVFSDVFDVLEEEVNQYDTIFPPKEKKYQQSQDDYQKISIEIDE
jgi:predicted N-acetyltransferase YhbS